MNLLELIKQYANVLIALAIASVTFYIASLYYNHKIDIINNEFSTYKHTNEQNIANQKISILAQQNKLKEENEILQTKLKEVENDKYKVFSELQTANSKLKSNVANGTDRLFIHANCPGTTNNSSSEAKIADATSLDNGETTKAVIDSRDATAIIEITNKGDKYKGQLEACQEWIEKLVTENNK